MVITVDLVTTVITIDLKQVLVVHAHYRTHKLCVLLVSASLSLRDWRVWLVLTCHSFELWQLHFLSFLFLCLFTSYFFSCILPPSPFSLTLSPPIVSVLLECFLCMLTKWWCDSSTYNLLMRHQNFAQDALTALLSLSHNCYPQLPVFVDAMQNILQIYE